MDIPVAKLYWKQKVDFRCLVNLPPPRNKAFADSLWAINKALLNPYLWGK